MKKGDRYQCGPVSVRIRTEAPGSDSARAMEAALNLYSTDWGEPEYEVMLDLLRPEEVTLCSGKPYLTTQRMSVLICPDGLDASCESGARGHFCRTEQAWSLGVPVPLQDVWMTTDLENLITLVLATSWREAGWVPFHAGMICRDSGPAAMICASSGVGKTTLTLAMLRRGWRTLGDDKLLLRPTDAGAIESRALVPTFNLYPHARDWFPELGDIEMFPRYSVWTDKRRVPVDRIFPGAFRKAARPTHVLKLVRSDKGERLKTRPLSIEETVSVLMQQTVIPSQRDAAQMILRTVANLSRQVVGIEVEMGDQLYLDPDHLSILEEAIESNP